MSALTSMNIEKIGAQLAAIDTDAAVEQLAIIDAELERVARASRDLESQLMASRRQRIARLDGPDPDRAASAILDGTDILNAVDTVAAIDERIASLNAAKRGLAQRERDQRDRREIVQAALKMELRAALEPVAAAIDAEAAETFGQLTILGAAAAELFVVTGVRSQQAITLDNLLLAAQRFALSTTPGPVDENLAGVFRAALPAFEVLGRRGRARAFMEPTATVGL